MEECFARIRFSSTTITGNMSQNTQKLIPQTGLALMGFSRYCPSSLDLPIFVVRSCRGAAAENTPSGLEPAISDLGPAQAWPRPDFWKSGNLGTWKSRKLGSNKSQIKKIKMCNVQIRSAQNVGKAWISRKQILLAPFGAISGIFPWTRKIQKTYIKFACFPLRANGPLSLIHISEPTRPY